MGNTDSMPLVSQTKSLVQLVAGDTAGAKQTQKNFIKGCPVVSQYVSVVQVLAGDSESAKETQKYFGKTMLNSVNSVPIIGHIKGGIHYAFGDEEGGKNAMIAATRTVGVAAGGIGGFMLAGPAGAAAGGVYGGTMMDGFYTFRELGMTGECCPYGHFRAIERALDGKMTPGEAFDAVLATAFDGLKGYGCGKAYANFAEVNQFQENITEAIDNGEVDLAAGEVGRVSDHIQELAHDANKVMQEQGSPDNVAITSVIDKDGNKYIGHSFRYREANKIDAFKGQPASVQRVLSNHHDHAARAQIVRGAAQGEPSCAEIDALNQFHQANGDQAVPHVMITLKAGVDIVQALPRCGNCQKIGVWIPMGKVVTDGIGGVPVPIGGVPMKVLVCACVNGGERCSTYHRK